ncbi:hypothetical protein [Tellurirhabdus bombi]|uniref:hypothetical protein n=1 Tax=Tellurirhabdus bombi TaxID=2907205 RepID=UPI001F1B5F5D|nr:hypothetical protein [Tellurirhabdus bombi]
MKEAVQDTVIKYDNTGRVGYLPAIHAVVTGLPAINARPDLALMGARPTEPVIERMHSPGDDQLIYWGDGNDFPQRIIELASKNTVIPQALNDKAALWIGGGVFAAADEDSDVPIKGNSPVDLKIRAFLKNITTKRYLLEATQDIAWWVNAFPEFILSKDRSEIVQLHNNETPYCRWGRMNERTGALDTVYINANWPQARATDATTTKLPAINPYQYDRVDAVRKGKAFKYIYPISFPSPGKSYYQLAAWDSARSSGWLEGLAAIPEFKKFALQNQMTLKYHIQIPEEYWERVYGERWTGGSTDEKMAIRDGFLSALMDRLTNIKNAHKGVMTDTWYDAVAEEHVGIKIDVLKDNHVEGKFNDDYSEGIANLLYALGVDPTLFGFASDKLGARSGGSDKREAFWIFVSKAKPYRDRILEPLQFAAEYNGWTKHYPDLTFKFRDTLLTTLDTGHSTAKQAS